MTTDPGPNTDSDSVSEKPRKRVLLSYRFGDQSRFDIVQQIAVRLRFFSIEVVLDQRSLNYGDDIRDFMRDEIRLADAVILVITQDFNDALSAVSSAGEGVRFEVQSALEEKAVRPGFQIIPLLLDGTRPVHPFDRMKCAVPEALDEVVTQLRLVSIAGESRVLRQRYRVDRLVETRGVAEVFHGWDMVVDIPVEIYLVRFTDENLKHRFNGFERVVKGRSSVSSPFLLNLRDTHIDGNGAYYLITERFEGTNLAALLAEGSTHVFGALCLALQISLGLYELHSVGVVHGGLVPRCIRLGRQQTSCKIVDFEFATPPDLVAHTANHLAGYPIAMPPERLAGAPVSVAQDVYQVGSLLLHLICRKRVVSRLLRAFHGSQDDQVLEVEEPGFSKRLFESLSDAVGQPVVPAYRNTWLAERVRETSSERFLQERLVPFLAWCLDPDPNQRPRDCAQLVSVLHQFGTPPTGHLVDPEGVALTNSLFPAATDRL